MAIEDSPTEVNQAEYVGFDATNYTAFGSFNPVYRNVWTELTESYQVPFARTVFFVLTAHIMHANELGIHFAGVSEIAAIACYSDTTVLRAEMALSELGWLKMHWIKDPTHPRGKALPRYQISPWIMWIAQPFIADAIAWWLRAVDFNRSSLRRNETIKAQPESESRIRPRNTTRDNNQNEEPEQRKQGEKQTRKRQTTGEQPEKQPRKRLYPAEIAIDECRKPIQDQQAERLAQTIAERFQTRQPQARQAILSYGAAAVSQAVDAMMLEVQDGKVIERPFGYLLSQLRKNPPSSDNPTGSYSDLFNR